MRDYDLIIFDCDGVLVDSELLSCRCLSALLARHGIDAGFETILTRFLGRSVTSVVQHYEALGCKIPEEFATELRTRVREAFAASLVPIRGVDAVLRGLRTGCCVASSSDHERVMFSLEFTGLKEFFGGRLYTAEMVARGKPAPDLFLHAASSMNATPARTLVIEDSISGVQAGKAAGMTVWGFVGGSHYTSRDGRELLAAGADRVFDRMEDFQPHEAGTGDVVG